MNISEIDFEKMWGRQVPVWPLVLAWAVITLLLVCVAATAFGCVTDLYFGRFLPGVVIGMFLGLGAGCITLPVLIVSETEK